MKKAKSQFRYSQSTEKDKSYGIFEREKGNSEYIDKEEEENDK
jgi:hypothetical protein